MVEKRDVEALAVFGGVEAVASALGSNPAKGVHGSDGNIATRRELFGSNTYQRPPPRGFLHFALEALCNTSTLILLVCAVISLGLGIKQNGAKEGWREAGIIFLDVILVVFVSAIGNFKEERKFDKLSKINENIKVEVVRNGKPKRISIFEIVVGDIVSLKSGDQIPANGLFVAGHSLEVDESCMTGESNRVTIESIKNPFFISGSKVVNGYAQMLVTSVGTKTAWGELMSLISRDTNERTPLKARLDKLTSSVGKVGLIVAFLVLVVRLSRYFTGHIKDENGVQKYNGRKTDVDDIVNAVLRMVADAVAIFVVAIPNGLPFAISLTLAKSMDKMMSERAMVKNFSAFETMASATVICTAKTGILTLNQMRVTNFWLGQGNIQENFFNQMASHVLEILQQGVGLNTTGSVHKPSPISEPEISGSPTEKAILLWATSELLLDIDKLKQKYTVLDAETFNSEKKRSGIAIRKESDKTVHVHWKGAAEVILTMCSSYINSNGETKSLDIEDWRNFEKIIKDVATSSLRCIAFAYLQNSGSEQVLKKDGLTLLGIVGLKDPCRPDVYQAVEACRQAGVEIKMITGDNIFTATAVAAECGILDLNNRANTEEVIEGEEFRNYTEEERMQKVEKIRVMARSTPLDKLLMVKCLKQKGHVFSVTGKGTNDVPALKEANIGLSMGIQGTELAKESSDSIIMDDNFSFVATILNGGRYVYVNIQKFISFQLTLNFAALVTNFIASVSTGDVILTAVPLLWVNLIVDTLGALALAIKMPTEDLLKRKPVCRTEPLITNIMWRDLSAQVLFQICMLMIISFYADVNEGVKKAAIFLTCVSCQIFNVFNALYTGEEMVFNIYRTFLLLGIIIFLEIVMAESQLSEVQRLTIKQEAACLFIAALSYPFGWIAKLLPVPEKPFFSYFRSLNLLVIRIRQAF